MCGFAGLLTPEPPAEPLALTARRMAAALAHRGPDDDGAWADGEAGVALGFRRLAIVDLSPEGHQPMASASGRFVVAFNGEVYNHVELRRELEAGGARFRGHSDTEVMLAAFEAWGVEGAVRRFVGMFALALWDARLRRLHLVRDRLGIKPLYVHARPGMVAFGSELKALLAGPRFDREVDRDALASYLRHLYVPAPRTIFRHVRKLPPGTVLTIDDARAPLPEPVPFWSAEEAALRGVAGPWQGTDDEAADEAERVIADAVALRMRADVPLGAFLSGGVDSSLVVALMQARSARPVRTFTVGFSERGWDESPHAAAVARHLGTDHTAVTLTGADALALVPDLPELFDEPLADPSQLPTFLVSRLARGSVAVALSGDGGDELFAGYNRYLHGAGAIGRASALPPAARRAAAALVSGGAAAAEGAGARGLLRHRAPGDRLRKVAALLREPDAAAMYRSLVSQWQDPAAAVVGAREPATPADAALSAPGLPLLERMMLADQLGYLPDDLLAKVDRASMAVGLEARVPLLDHRVAELAWRLPRRFKVRGGEGKWVLRRILHRHVPAALVDRPKMGFSVPIDAWLRGPLRPWAEDLLSPARLRADGLLDADRVARAWRDFLAGRGRGGMSVWAVLVFQAWHQRWLAGQPADAVLA
jgi:asparagine synthase (glutamine-hydrolysing)